MTNKTLIALSACLLAGLTACEGADDGVDSQSSNVIGGQPIVRPRPEIGQLTFLDLQNVQRTCTAAAMGPRVVLTAAHCVQFSNLFPERYTFAWTSEFGGPVRRTPIVKIVNLGPDAGRYLREEEVNDFAFANLRAVGGIGNNDVAIAFLRDSVESRAFIEVAADNPVNGEVVSLFGYGCTIGATLGGGGSLRQRSWFYQFPTGLRDNAQKLGAICPGDSGGPDVHGSPSGFRVWGVNSSSNGTWDSFGNAAAFRQRIDQEVQSFFNTGAGHF
jgi:hypothetical protein